MHFFSRLSRCQLHTLNDPFQTPDTSIPCDVRYQRRFRLNCSERPHRCSAPSARSWPFHGNSILSQLYAMVSVSLEIMHSHRPRVAASAQRIQRSTIWPPNAMVSIRIRCEHSHRLHIEVEFLRYPHDCCSKPDAMVCIRLRPPRPCSWDCAPEYSLLCQLCLRSWPTIFLFATFLRHEMEKF